MPDVPDVALLTVGEITVILRVSRAVVYRLIRDGSLHSVRVGSGLRVPASSLRRFLGGTG